MNTKQARALWLLLALAAPMIAPEAFGQSEYKMVAASALVSNPQNFWARGIVFHDILVSAPQEGSSLKIDGKLYKALVLKTVGSCYIENSLVPLARELPLDRRVVFKGTVLQSVSSWFFGKKIYLVIITGFEAAVDTDKLSDNFEKMYNRMDQVPPKGSTQALTSLLAEIQTALSTYACANNVEVSQLLSDDAEASKKALGVIYDSIHDLELKNKTTSAEILASYILTFLRAEYSKEEAPAEPAKAPASIPAPAPAIAPEPAKTEPAAPPVAAPVVEPAPAAPVVVTPPPAPVVETSSVDKTSSAPVSMETPAPETNQPPKLSWMERRRLERAKKAAENEEKARIAREEKLKKQEEEAARQAEELKAREERRIKEEAERQEQERLAAEKAEAKRQALEAKKAERARIAAEKKAQQQAAAEAKAQAKPEPEPPAPADAKADYNEPVGR